MDLCTIMPTITRTAMVMGPAIRTLMWGWQAGCWLGAVAATFLLVAAELTGGYVGHSISLVSDALHNLSDIPTLLISLDRTALDYAPSGSRTDVWLSARGSAGRVC